MQLIRVGEHACRVFGSELRARASVMQTATKLAVSSLVALATCLGLTGCVTTFPPSLFAHRDAVVAELENVKKSGRPVQLRDLTEFAWDQVHVFGPGAACDDIEATVGAPVYCGEDQLRRSLMVFENGGEVVQEVFLADSEMFAFPATQPADVWVVPSERGSLGLTVDPN